MAITISPISATVSLPATGSLTPDQVVSLQTALATEGITFAGGNVRQINIMFKPDFSARYVVSFYPSTGSLS